MKVVNATSLKTVLLFLLMLSASYGMILGAHVLARGSDETILPPEETYLACECEGLEEALSSEALFDECCK